MLKNPEEYADEQAILEEMAERAETGGDEMHAGHYQQDIRWLITKLISESERPIATFYDLDAVPEPDNLRAIGGVLSILGTYARDRAQAIELRSKGREEDALEFDRSCQAIYNRLPDWAKWGESK